MWREVQRNCDDEFQAHINKLVGGEFADLCQDAEALMPHWEQERRKEAKQFVHELRRKLSVAHSSVRGVVDTIVLNMSQYRKLVLGVGNMVPHHDPAERVMQFCGCDVIVSVLDSESEPQFYQKARVSDAD